jgi:Ca-activated chloride channel homolog
MSVRCALTALVFIVASSSRGQESFRVTTNLVNVSFSARDSSGALVGSLTKDDLEVYEDSVPQKIAFFSHSVDLPLTLGLVVDFSSSQEHFYARHKDDLKLFLKEILGTADRAFLVCFGNRISLASDFSHSGTDLLEHLKDCERGKHSYQQLGPPEERVLGTAFYDSIYYSVVEKLSNESGKRALLVFSDGEDNSSSHDMMTAIETAQNVNVIVYSIRYTDSPHGELTARNQYGMRVMDRIAKETGGRHFDAKTLDPHEYLEQIAAELRTSYDLAYYPQKTIKDQTFRKILVQARQPGLTIRARTGYFPR